MHYTIGPGASYPINPRVQPVEGRCIDLTCSRATLWCWLMWPGSWVCKCLLRSLDIMSREVWGKSWTTGGRSGGWRTEDEGQRNSECKVRKGLKGECALQKVRWVKVLKVLHCFVLDKRDNWHGRDEVKGVCVCVCVCQRKKAKDGYWWVGGGWVVGSRNRFGEG